jgi:hypothetical protein
MTKERPDAECCAGPIQKSIEVSTTTTDEKQSNPAVRRGHGRELLAQLQRRYEAAKRLPPLPSGRRDPLTPRERADCWERP